MTIKIKEIKPQIWNFKVIGGKKAWEEVAYSARMSGVPPYVTGEDIFKMIIKNDYGSALEHVIIKFDIKMSKGNAPELLEHRISSHSGFSTRYIQANKGIEKKDPIYEIITPWHLVKRKNGKKELEEQRKIFLQTIKTDIENYEDFLGQGLPRESARYILPFCQAVGIYHFTINLRSLINLLSLRLCARVSPEMRCLASQLYFNLKNELPIIEGLVGCRGFMKRICPESGVTGVREGEQHPVYPPCLFKSPLSEIYIPTQKEFAKGGTFKKFDRQKAIKAQEFNFKKWADWTGE